MLNIVQDQINVKNNEYEKIKISVFANNVESQKCSCKFKELTNKITKIDWSHILFKKNYRTSENFLSTKMCVLDVDGDLTLTDAVNIFKDYKHIIATTRSHQLEKNGNIADRFRILLFLDKEIYSSVAYEEFTAATFSKWPFCDKQCGDAARFWYKSADIYAVKSEGKLLNVEQILLNNKVFEKGGRTKALLSEAGKIWGRQAQTAATLAEQIKEKNALLENPLTDLELEKKVVEYVSSRPFNSDAWKFNLRHNDNGKLTRSMHNLCLILENDFDLKINVRNGAVYVNNVISKPAGIRKTISSDYHLEFTTKEINEALSLVKTTFDPVKDLISSFKWDGVHRLHNLAEYFNATDTTQANVYLRKMFIAAIARTFHPGCQVDTCCILKGAQGIKKSSMINIMALKDEWFTDDLNVKDQMETARHIRSKFIIEFGELSNLPLHKIEQTKMFITKKHDANRALFSNDLEELPRRCVFWASTNNTNFFRDATGNRRFWVVQINNNPLNLVKFRNDIEQLYAEALIEYYNKEDWWLTPEEQKINDMENETYQENESFHDDIVIFLAGNKGEFTIHQLYEHINCFAIKAQQTATNSRSFARTLRQLGYTDKPKRINGFVTKVWAKKEG